MCGVGFWLLLFSSVVLAAGLAHALQQSWRREVFGKRVTADRSRRLPWVLRVNAPASFTPCYLQEGNMQFMSVLGDAAKRFATAAEADEFARKNGLNAHAERDVFEAV